MLNQSNPTNEQEEKSLDFRLFCGFQLCMVVAIVAHLIFKMGFAGEAAVASVATVVAVVLSVRNRIQRGWHWPGTRLQDVLWAFAAGLLVAFFFGAALPGRSPLNPTLFPWCASGACILLFAVLNGLGIVCESERDFLRHCGAASQEQQIAPPRRPVRSWKRMLVNAFQIYFLLVWIAGVIFFWKFSEAYNSGSQVETATQTEGLSNHGRVVYITPKEKQWVYVLQYSVTIGLPSVLVIGALLHFVVGVKVFSQASSKQL